MKAIDGAGRTRQQASSATQRPTGDCFATSVALRERKSIAERLRELGGERQSTWRDREIGDLQRYLLEVDGAIARHREATRLRGH